MSITEAPRTAAMDLAEKVRLATMPAVRLLAETRSALLLVDVQNRFIFGAAEPAPGATAPVMQPTGKLLRTARTRDIPRFYVTVGHAPPASNSAPWMRRLNDMGADVKGRLTHPPLPAAASEIPAEIAPLPGEIHLTKWRFSAFYETALEVLAARRRHRDGRDRRRRQLRLHHCDLYRRVLARLLSAAVRGGGGRRRAHDAPGRDGLHGPELPRRRRDRAHLDPQVLTGERLP